MGFTPKRAVRESLSKDDAKLLRKILEWARVDGASINIDFDSERVDFLLAKLKRLEK